MLWKPSTQILGFSLLLCPWEVSGQARVFVDDHGVQHSTDKAKPTFVTRARNALFFIHHGADTSQLVATYGNFFSRGSNLNLDSPAMTDALNTDPTVDDIQVLKSIPTLSPACYDQPVGCQELDLDLLRAMDPKPDFWLYIDNGSQDGWAGFFTDYVGNITDIMGKPPIFIDTLFEHGQGCRNSSSTTWNVDSKNANTCYSRSVIDVIQRSSELSDFLGLNVEDKEGQQAMCEAAQRFSNVAEAAHQRGVRAALTWINVLPESVYVALFSPFGDTFPRTLEELGMPLIHAGLCLGQPCNAGIYGPDYEIINASTWFVNCEEGQELNTCNDETTYGVDFWLMGGRELQLLDDMDFFRDNFPDKAILAGQYAHVPMNDGGMSFEGVARFLNDISDRLETAQSFYSDRQCQSVDVTSNEHTSYANNLEQNTVNAGNVACFDRNVHQAAYKTCPAAGSSAGHVIAPLVISTMIPLMISLSLL